jgi:DNA polymerase
MMEKEKLLGQLKTEVQEKELPLKKGATQIVFGDGNCDSELFFLGEAPGYFEDQKGIPFVGRAGQLLDETLEKIGIPRKDIWISNVIYYRPPENRDPSSEEIAAFRPYVDRQIEIIDPKIIITLGRFSMAKFAPGVKISQAHGKPRWIMFGNKKRVMIPMYHPAAALRSTNLLDSFRTDFLNIPKVIKKVQDLDLSIEPKNKSEQPRLF